MFINANARSTLKLNSIFCEVGDADENACPLLDCGIDEIGESSNFPRTFQASFKHSSTDIDRCRQTWQISPCWAMPLWIGLVVGISHCQHRWNSPLDVYVIKVCASVPCVSKGHSWIFSRNYLSVYTAPSGFVHTLKICQNRNRFNLETQDIILFPLAPCNCNKISSIWSNYFNI